MKTSKILFIILLSLGALYVSAAMFEVRLTGKKGEIFNTDGRVNNITIRSFNALCITDCKNLNIEESDSAYFTVISRKDSILPEINYEVKNDTLFILGLQTQPSDNNYVRLYIGNNLKSIQLKNSNIFIIEQSSEYLSITLDNSSLSSGNNKNSLFFGTVKISAMNNSTINMNSLKADSLEVFLRNSKAFLMGSSKKMNGLILDKSRLSASQNGELSVKKDASSKITLY